MIADQERPAGRVGRPTGDNGRGLGKRHVGPIELDLDRVARAQVVHLGRLAAQGERTGRADVERPLLVAFEGDDELFGGVIHALYLSRLTEHAVGIDSRDLHIVLHLDLIADFEVGRLEQLLVHDVAAVERYRALRRTRQRDGFGIVAFAECDGELLLGFVDIADNSFKGNDALDADLRGAEARLLADVADHYTIVNLQIGQRNRLLDDLIFAHFRGDLLGDLRFAVEEDSQRGGDADVAGLSLVFTLGNRQRESALVDFYFLDLAGVNLGAKRLQLDPTPLGGVNMFVLHDRIARVQVAKDAGFLAVDEEAVLVPQRERLAFAGLLVFDRQSLFVGKNVADDEVRRPGRGRGLFLGGRRHEKHQRDHGQQACQERSAHDQQPLAPPALGGLGQVVGRCLGEHARHHAVGAQVAQRVEGRLITAGLVLGRHALDHAGQILGHALQHAAHFGQVPVGGGVPHHPGDLLIAAKVAQARKQRLKLRSAHQFIGRKSQRVEVGGRSHGAKLIGKQFRRHVLRGSLEQTSFLAHRPPRQSEIAELYPVLIVDQQVARLDVAVNDAVGVEKVQRVERAGQGQSQKVQVDRFALGHLLHAAAHQFQDQPAARAHQVVDRQDVGVLQRGQELRLLPVAGQLPLVGQEVLMNLLDRDLAAQFAVPRARHRGEITTGDGFDDFVAGVVRHENKSGGYVYWSLRMSVMSSSSSLSRSVDPVTPCPTLSGTPRSILRTLRYNLRSV